MPPATVNAYHTLNNIVFPIGIFKKPFVDVESISSHGRAELEKFQLNSCVQFFVFLFLKGHATNHEK